MKRPIELNEGNLSSIITAMLLEVGQDKYTMSFEKFKDLDLENKCLYCEGEWIEGHEEQDYPDSVSVTVMTLEELAMARLTGLQ